MKQAGEYTDNGVPGFKPYTVNGVLITPYKQWAVNLMKREASGEQVDEIARQFWREALGYPADMDAKKARESSKQQQEAA